MTEIERKGGGGEDHPVGLAAISYIFQTLALLRTVMSALTHGHFSGLYPSHSEGASWLRQAFRKA